MNHTSKKQLCCAGLLCLFTSLNTLSANSDTANQSLKITIPKIALVELDKAKHSFVFTPDKNIIRHTSNVAISSNDRNARLNISVKGLPDALQLDILANTEICSGLSTQTRNNQHQFNCQVGIARTRNGLLTITGSRKNQQALPNGTYTADITYTLSD